MTAAVEPGATARRTDVGITDARRSGLLLAALALAVAARYLGTSSGVADGTTIGLAFGLALLAVAAVDARGIGLGHGASVAGAGPVGRLGSRPVAVRARAAARSVAIGLLGGGALIGLAVFARALGGNPIGLLGGGALIGLAVFARALGGNPIGPSMGALAGGGLFPGWAVATIVVAGGEEGLLRGALFDRIASIAGPWWAIGVTSLAFALMHVPFYGWHVVPLDLGVGIWLAGLRLETGGILAPWLAHALADLATWWL